MEAASSRSPARAIRTRRPVRNRISSTTSTFDGSDMATEMLTVSAAYASTL